MAKDKHPNQEQAAKRHAETGNPGENISFSPYRVPPYQYEATLAETEKTDADQGRAVDPNAEIPATGDVVERG